MGVNDQLLGQFAVTENLQHVVATLRQTSFGQSLRTDRVAVVEFRLEERDVQDQNLSSKLVVVEAPFGDQPRQRHLAAGEATTRR